MKNAFLRNLGKFAAKHASEILTGFGIAGMFTAVILAVENTTKAEKLIKERQNQQDDPLNKTEIVKAAWKSYIPTAVACLGAVGCLIAANAVNVKRSAALTAAYALSETTLLEYRNKVAEEMGDRKAEEIRNKIVQDKIDKTPPSKSDVIIVGNGDVRCYDVFAGGYFQSNKNKLDRAVNELNRRILEDDYACLNDFYDAIDRPHTKSGDLLGWNNSHGNRGVNIKYSSHLAPDGEPCLAFEFDLVPKYEYDLY